MANLKQKKERSLPIHPIHMEKGDEDRRKESTEQSIGVLVTAPTSNRTLEITCNWKWRDRSLKTVTAPSPESVISVGPYAHSVKHALAHTHAHTHTHTHTIIYVVLITANEPRNSTGPVLETWLQALYSIVAISYRNIELNSICWSKNLRETSKITLRLKNMAIITSIRKNNKSSVKFNFVPQPLKRWLCLMCVERTGGLTSSLSFTHLHVRV